MRRPHALILLAALGGLATGCADASDASDAHGGDSTADAADTTKPFGPDCEILTDEDGGYVQCVGATPADEVPCPEGYTCSGPSAFWCTRGTCQGLPICLPPDAAIATPGGPRHVADLRAGDLVWSHEGGERVAVPIARTGRAYVGSSHHLLVVALSDGRTLRASPGHPDAAGHVLMALSVGADYDGASVVDVVLTRYAGKATFDLLPASASGVYWVDGVAVSSTLAPAADVAVARAP